MAIVNIERMPKVSLDESGNTGEDLLGDDQQVYVLGSTSLSTSESAALISDAGISGAKELKFSSLRKSPGGRAAVLRVISQLTPTTAKAAIVNKRFMIVAKMVDTLVETLAWATDFNLYESGAHRALTEVWYATMPVLLGIDETDELLRHFVSMCRRASLVSIEAFYELVADLRTRTTDPHMQGELDLLAATRGALTIEVLRPQGQGDGLDPAIPALVATAIEWGKTLGVPFSMRHDDADVIRRWMPQFERYLFDGSVPKLVGSGSRSFTLPLLAADLTFVDSKIDPCVQVADVVAGATASWAKALVSGSPSPFDQELDGLGIAGHVLNAVWPTGDLTPDKQDSGSLIDDVTKYLEDR
jgi:hypothetical protein